MIWDYSIKTMKKLMEGYIGVRFDAVSLGGNVPFDVDKIFPEFCACCRRLRKHKMTYANAGNISVRFKEGFIITSTGSNLSCLDKDEIVFVEKCDIEKQKVSYRGAKKPSSETMMHYLIYQERPKANAIIHAHDEAATKPELLKGKVTETLREEPYGSLALARMAIGTFKNGDDIIVLKNHGYVAVGSGLKEACGLIIDMHKLLLA